MMRAWVSFHLLFALLWPLARAAAQSPPEPKRIEAVRTLDPVSIDALLSEPVWRRPGNSGFTQRDPNEGHPPSQKTEVWIAYDDEALFVAAQLHDSIPDSIVTRIGRRDTELNSDWFFVGIDSYHDKRTGFYFGVTPSQSIADGVLFNDEEDDGSWDGVWEVAATVDAKGWAVEMRIPYSQLRFPKLEEYVWGINFLRIIERHKEEDYFVMVPKKESGAVSRYAHLTGICGISPPARLEILPYVASAGKFLNHQRGDPFNDGSILDQQIGADMKIGLGSNLTLNATLNPDFGQVEVDPAVVNLTQFETFFEDKRPFFVEGSHFFNFGRGGANNFWGFNWSSANFFYSRRIGRRPQGGPQHSGFVDLPDRTTIGGAAKLTGRISGSWTLGALQSFTVREYADVDSAGFRYSDVVEPFSSYSVVRVLREFNEGKQAIGLMGTAALHDLNQPYLTDQYNRRSFSIGIDGWTNIDEDRMWVATGWVAGTRIEGSPSRIHDLQRLPARYYQRPDADHLALRPNATSLNGYGGRIAVNKQKGNWQFNSAFGILSPGFDSNDLGFLFQTDVINAHVVAGYQWFDPDGTLRRKRCNVATFRNYDFGGNKIGEGYFLFYNAELMSYWGIEGNLNFSPAVLDTRITRGGPAMKTTNQYGASFYAYSDSREPAVLDLSVFGGRSESGGYAFQVSPGVDWKPSSRVKIRFSPNILHDVTIAYWVHSTEDSTAARTDGTRYVFGKLDQKEVSATIRIDWTFTPRLSFQLFLQPLFSVGSYSEFKEFAQPGTYTFTLYGQGGSTIAEQRDAAATIVSYAVDPDANGPAPSFTIRNPDFNFKSLRGNAIVRWEYLPGSTLFLVWTQSRLNFTDPGSFRFGRDFSSLLSTDADNVFLLKLTYWITP